MLRGNDEIVAWMLMVCRYARSLHDEARGLRRGQFDCSYAELARRFQSSIERDPVRANDAPRWTKAKAKAFCAKLERNGSITTETVGKKRDRTTRFTICKYNKWQPERRQNATTGEQPMSNRPATDEQPMTPSNINDLAAATTGEQPVNNRPTTGEQPHRETLLRDTEKDTPSEAASAASGEGSKPAKPKKGDTPSVPGVGDWPTILTNAKATGFPYPAEFLEIWGYWRSAAKMNPEVKRQAVGKWLAYRRILEWLNDGLAVESVAAATRDYLRPFCTDRKKTHCKMPETIYSRANPILTDLCDDSEAGAMVSPRPWNNPTSAFVDIKRAARNLSLPIPPIDKFSATWEQIEGVNPDILTEARRLAQ